MNTLWYTRLRLDKKIVVVSILIVQILTIVNKKGEMIKGNLCNRSSILLAPQISSFNIANKIGDTRSNKGKCLDECTKIFWFALKNVKDNVFKTVPKAFQTPELE